MSNNYRGSYEKDKNVRLTLRVNEDLFAFVHKSAQIMGVSPSEYIRIVLNTLRSTANSFEEGFCRGNEKTDIDHIV